MKENLIAKILFIIGTAIMVIGFITGLAVGNMSYDYDFGIGGGMVWSIFFTYFFAGIISGMLFIGLSEIIRLLHSMNNEIGYKTPMPEKAPADSSQNQPPDKWGVSQTDKEKIYDLYQNERILEIIPSNIEGYCLVKMADDSGKQFVRIVDIGGFGATETNETAIKQRVIAWYNEKGN
ncbi:hypothetical protein F3157_09350 [Virgibacillus dakarensis]|uniref:hypothetical protein n=1 Tax=Virgibacillus dakarensis TaxID=1917889 RepID=UPI000B4384F9|nr:hypothetical protein [Virgibacillus dakarensis]MTW85861.1 hypothetical protein [Virgibacillus dakarensis]